MKGLSKSLLKNLSSVFYATFMSFIYDKSKVKMEDFVDVKFICKTCLS